ncbi:MAG: PepSY domain-containing protein [Candidatus Thiodiazotropha sp. (ex Monitilora ramsayi)]|nr:PepSY domain-containing protein [Candidatus Thiodiazotropha sp. (ex Monitilora ramsayi)]
MNRTSIISALAGVLLIGSALADDGYLHARRLVEEGRIQPLTAILEQAQRIQSGSVLEVELEEEDDLLIYEIELLDESGRVWELKFDAATGELVERELED